MRASLESLKAIASAAVEARLDSMQKEYGFWGLVYSRLSMLRILDALIII